MAGPQKYKKAIVFYCTELPQLVGIYFGIPTGQSYADQQAN